MSDAGDLTRRRGSSPAAAPASLPDDDDLLREILLRLPSQPSSLVRASAVCKRWRRLATDPKFLQCFRDRGPPPLLGVFEEREDNIVFIPTLSPPDRIPPERFDVRLPGVGKGGRSVTELLGCRHGRVLVMDWVQYKVVVCDPITGERCRLDAPPAEFDITSQEEVRGAVLCAAAGHGHVHGSCRSSPYKVVLISLGDKNRPVACVYSSETGNWGNLIPAVVGYEVYLAFKPGVLVGNALYWLSEDMSDTDMLYLGMFTDDIVEFDLDRQSLAVIKGPPLLNDSSRHQIIQAEDGNVGLAMLSYPTFQLWQRKVNFHGDTTWLLWKTVQMDTILGVPPLIEGAMRMRDILGYDEDNGAVFLYVDGNVYVVQLKSMQYGKIHETDYTNEYHPFTSFYAPGIAVADGCDGAEMLHDCLV